MKTPVEIKISKEGTLTINVNLESQDKVKNASAIAKDQDSVDLEMRLMTVDDSDESKVLALNMDILKFAESKLKSGKRQELLKFLNDNKHRFNSDLKEWLRDTITSKVKS